MEEFNSLQISTLRTFFCQESRQNDRNISTRHMTGSIVEGNMLLAFGHLLCFDMLGVVGSSFKMIKFFMLDDAWYYTCLAKPCPMAKPCPLVRFEAPNMSLHVATGWPNERNMLRPSMFRSVASACCDRFPGLANAVPKMMCCCIENEINVAIVWMGLANAGLTMLRSFGRDFKIFIFLIYFRSIKKENLLPALYGRPRHCMQPTTDACRHGSDGSHNSALVLSTSGD